MANAGCINAYDCNGCLIQTLQNLDSACIGVGVQYTAPNPLDDKRLDYIKYTDKCGCVQCLSGENEILIYATDGVIKDLTLTNDDVNEVVNVKWTEVFGSNRAKTVVRYKTTGYPTSPTDGTLAVESTVKNQYATNGFNVSGLEDGTTYYFSAFAIDNNDTMINVQNSSITTDFGYVVNANTLFFIKNDGEISDHSQYNHTMSWYGTSKFYTLSNGRKVAHFDGSNGILSNVFSEANNLTTFTLHFWRKRLGINDTNGIIFGRAGRKKDDSATSDRRGMRFQTVDDTNTGQKQETILFGDTVGNWGTVGTSNYIPVPETEFQLFTATVNGNVFKLYKNGVLQKSFTSTTIRGGSSTGPRYYLGKAFHPDGSLRGGGPLCYIGENVLENKTETDAEVLDFYNKTKNHYV